ncbi:MAG: hypothetical protein WD077_12185 [Bacteroidia bacterium]
MDNKKDNEIETPYWRLWIEDQILIGVIKENTVFDLETAKNTVNDRLKVTGGKSYPICMDVRNIKSITKEARDFLATSSSTSGLIAAAFIVESSANRIMANIFVTFNQPKLPLKLFNEMDSALKWLERYKRSD